MIAGSLEDVLNDFGIPTIVPQDSLPNIFRNWRISRELSKCADNAFVSRFFFELYELT